MQDPLDILVDLSLFKGQSRDGFTISRLGGLTNLVYRVDINESSYLLRLPGKGTEEYIDRVAEAHDARAAAAVDVSAEVLYFDTDSGIMLAEYIDGVTLNQARFKDLASVTRSAQAFRRLHASDVSFTKRFEVFEQIDEYLDLIGKLNADVPQGYEAVRDQAAGVRELLEHHPAKLAPCHCDPLAENFIDTGERVYIIDWEYAGNNDPMWDLGDLSVEAAFDSEQDRVLLESYFNGDVPADQAGRMVVYKMLCDLLWTLWGVVQHANGNPAEDFWDYSVTRFNRCRALLATSEFATALDAIRGE
ncbi:MAG: choline/ethanolamine kinase [marine bacterium B5-7]|nr:MAG: choline/ethanolamine kinase [marine bacterium B5-7]